MRFQTQMKVIGAKRFKDTVDGTLYDNTKLFVEVPLNDQNGNAVGTAAQEMAWGDSANFEKIKNLPFPFLAMCELEMVTNGKTSKTVIVGVTPAKGAAAQGQG
ncbi:hypothetical protein [Chromobacterium vaccinii]|uniref:Single-stranded DNA-binding protein n=1 Tax=Chromobacterium vaccinii TaxID=1108595 RepID=A0A1D9LCM7_9NEIS|nr:hypothetical protein [Chromobacterium vaccinii]AOZ49036.1 hypothetical protein BKX93_02815 [Chromobacterium vaccinii]